MSSPILRNAPETLIFAYLDGDGERIAIGDDFKSEKRKFRFFNAHVAEITKAFEGQKAFAKAMQDEPYETARAVFCVVYGWGEDEADLRMLEGCLTEYAEAISTCWSRWAGTPEDQIQHNKDLRARAEKKALKRVEEILDPTLEQLVADLIRTEIAASMGTEKTSASVETETSNGNGSCASSIEQLEELALSPSSGD